MKKYIPIYLYGAIVILEGFFLLFSEYTTFNVVKLTTGITLVVGAIFAFMPALLQQRKHVQFAYHGMHALAMFVYGTAVLMFCHTFEKLIFFSVFLFMFYSFSEIIFCFWLFNLGQKMVFKTIIIRFLLGLAIGIGTVIAMNFPIFTLEGFGVLFIIVGTNIMFYSPVIKDKEFSETQYESHKP